MKLLLGRVLYRLNFIHSIQQEIPAVSLNLKTQVVVVISLIFNIMMLWHKYLAQHKCLIS